MSIDSNTTDLEKAIDEVNNCFSCLEGDIIEITEERDGLLEHIEDLESEVEDLRCEVIELQKDLGE